jgi:ATP/maltotriose-dependent transcriptional regulator MalT/DNA-binding SARP family transcriptional activator
MLDDLLEYRLTLITAPAGYGKTSLLVDLADQVEYPVCWLALDPLDKDFLRFLNYFVAAIHQQFSEFGTASRSLINSLGGGDIDQEQVLNAIINDLYDHVQEHFALVLDDFHLIDSNLEINQFINRFVQVMDENCHLVIASRSLLSLPDLPLMVGRSQVKGLSFEELAFHPDEIITLLRNNYHQELSNQDAERIAEETEGWITALLLSAETTRHGLTDQGRAARAAGIDLYDYLAQQVLNQQPPDMQDFLLRTSLLEEFNSSLCQQALGNPAGEKSWQELIHQLLHQNLFIQPVDDGGTWLRYHHLFRDFLQQHCQQEYPQKAKELLHTLVDVYANHQWWEKAYSACKQLDDKQITADFIASACAALVHSGRITLLASWLDELPPALVDRNLGLLARRGALACLMGDSESGLLMLNRALGKHSRQEDPALFALMLIRRAACYRLLGNYQMGLNDALQALDLSKKASDGKILKAESNREIGLNQQQLGDIQEAKIHLERSLKSYLDQNDQKNAAFVEMDLGFLEMNEGNYSTARSLYRQAHHLWEGLGNLNQLVGLCNNLGVLDHLAGDYLQAFGWFTKALEYARQTSNLRGTAYTLASLADLALDLGAISKAEAYINESRILADEAGDTYLQIYLLLSLAALARRSEDYNRAREYLDSVEFQIRGNPKGIEMGKYHLECGCLLMHEDQLEQASAEFRAAQEIFSTVNMPVETTIALIYLVRIEYLGGSLLEAQNQLSRAQEIIQSLGTFQPLVPVLADQLVFLSSLGEHIPADRFIKDLIHAIDDFQTRLPGLLESMEFNRLASDASLSPMLDIYSMGRVYVKLNGDLITVPEWTKQKTVRELFFYLLNRSEGVNREEICVVFWPESKPEQLKKQFKNALYRLRRAVGKDSVLYHQPTRLYHFNRDLDYRYDVEAFQAAVKQAEQEADPELKIQALQQAADLYQHPFAPTLDGIWAEPVRHQLYRYYERTILTLAELQLSRGMFEASLETSHLLLQCVPSQEAAWRLAMRSYAAQGDRIGIERVFQQCRKALAQDLDAEPSKETYSLYHQLMI